MPAAWEKMGATTKFMWQSSKKKWVRQWHKLIALHDAKSDQDHHRALIRIEARSSSSVYANPSAKLLRHNNAQARSPSSSSSIQSLVVNDVTLKVVLAGSTKGSLLSINKCETTVRHTWEGGNKAWLSRFNCFKERPGVILPTWPKKPHSRALADFGLDLYVRPASLPAGIRAIAKPAKTCCL